MGELASARVRRYADAVVLYDPVAGRTYAISRDEFEVVRAIGELIGSRDSDLEDVMQRVLEELREDGVGGHLSAVDRANLGRWVRLALHLAR